MELSELSAKVDLYILTRDRRRSLQREVDDIQAEETELKNTIVSELTKANSRSVGGSSFICSIEQVDKPVAGDWSKTYEWIKENDSFDLLQKRLNEAAVLARWEEGIVIPGISKFPVQKLSVTKKA